MHVAPNGKRYIGITSQRPEYRWNGGRAYQNQPHFQNAIKKYGWNNIQHVILFSGLSKDEAIGKEIELIATFETTNPSKGYNITLGGEGSSGVKQSEETKKKMSEAQKKRMKDPEQRLAVLGCLSLAHSTPEIRQRHAEAIREAYKNPYLLKRISESRMGENNNFYGKRHSEETRAIIKEKRKSQVMTNGKPVLQFSMDGSFIGRYESGLQAANINRVSYKSLNCCLRGLTKSSGGFRWKYERVI